MALNEDNPPLTTDLIALDGAPQNKEGVMECLLDLAVDAGRVTDFDQTLQDLQEREKQATTGVGMGIGIPHAKSAAVVQPTIAFTRVPEGIDFDAVDDEPATLIFLLLVPESGGEDHLEMLSSLSRSLVHEATREALLEAEPPERVQETVLEAVS